MAMFCRDHAVKAAVPVIFLLALVPALLIAGRMASLLVALMASFIFAAFLFEPYGSVAIRSSADQIELVCFLLAAVGVVCFSPGAALSGGRDRVIRPSDRIEGWIAPVGYAVVLTAIVTMLLQMWTSMRY